MKNFDEEFDKMIRNWELFDWYTKPTANKYVKCTASYNNSIWRDSREGTSWRLSKDDNK